MNANAALSDMDRSDLAGLRSDGGPLPRWVREAARTSADPLASARALRDLIEADAAEAERRGRITDRVGQALVEAGLFGLLVPRELGGTESDPQTYIDTIEELSYADGSVGWVLLATTFGIVGAATLLEDDAIEEIFGSESGYICAGQLAPTGRAERTEGGYRVSGRFQFGSGSTFASWLYGAFVVQRNGRPLFNEKGTPEIVWGFFPRDAVRFDEGSWNVMGLRATASIDYEISDYFIPDRFWVSGKKRLRGGPSHDLGVSVAHVSWSLGVGMRALDEIAALASRKRRPGRASLIDQQVFQRDFGDNWAQLQACRALIRQVYAQWHEAAIAGQVGLEIKARARLAACWATSVTDRIGAFAMHAAGSDGVRNGDGNRLQRCFRDLKVGSTHKHMDENVFVECAQVLLGVQPETLEL